jgi:hypothetical protein
MKLPVVNASVTLLSKASSFRGICIDVFDGGFGYYFDLSLPKTTRKRFATGQQFSIPELGDHCLADFVSYPKGEDPFTVRLLVPKGV